MLYMYMYKQMVNMVVLLWFVTTNISSIYLQFNDEVPYVLISVNAEQSKNIFLYCSIALFELNLGKVVNSWLQLHVKLLSDRSATNHLHVES